MAGLSCLVFRQYHPTYMPAIKSKMRGTNGYGYILIVCNYVLAKAPFKYFFIFWEYGNCPLLNVVAITFRKC